MDNKPVSLGDSPKQSLKLIRQSVPLPTDRKTLSVLFSDILSMGLVQKISIEVGKDIVIHRFVSDKVPPPGTTLVTESEASLFEEAMFNPISEFEKVSTDGLKSMLSAFKHFELGYVPKAIFVSNLKNFSSWIGDEVKEKFFSYPVQVALDLPEDVVLITALDGNDSLWSIKVTMETKVK